MFQDAREHLEIFVLLLVVILRTLGRTSCPGLPAATHLNVGEIKALVKFSSTLSFW